jgi:hypothetical protein
MGLMEYILIGIGIVAALFAVGNLIIRVSVYYRQRFNMSVWAGVFVLVIAGVIGTYAVIHYDKPNLLLIAIAIVVAVLIVFLDIRHAGAGMGTTAFLFQIVMAGLFVFLLLVLALRFVINTATHRRGRQMLAMLGGAEAARLFFGFFVP